MRDFEIPLLVLSLPDLLLSALAAGDLFVAVVQTDAIRRDCWYRVFRNLVGVLDAAMGEQYGHAALSFLEERLAPLSLIYFTRSRHVLANASSDTPGLRPRILK